MENKGFTENKISIETPKDVNVAEKPLENRNYKHRKVDINILKARAQEIQNKENKKNILIFIFSLLVLVTLAVYLSS